MDTLRIDILPENAKNQIRDFYEFLVKKYTVNKEMPYHYPKRKFGSEKGIIKYMADDFDAPNIITPLY